MSRNLPLRLLVLVCAIGLLATAAGGAAFASPKAAPGQKSAALLPNEGKCDKKLAADRGRTHHRVGQPGPRSR